MNQRQKEILQAQLDSEKAVLKKLESNYQDALDEINSKIELLMSRQDADMQHVIYQVEYQKALKTQVQSILETLQTNEFETVSEYLTQSYEDGFIGTMYDLQGQGIPLVVPIDQKAVVEAIVQDTKLSENLYTSLGHDMTELKKKITGEISRGLSSGQMYNEIARNVSDWARIPKNNAMRIARTESHRIMCKAASDAQYKAKENGADVVKQWDSSLDKKTRKSHRKLDGQIRELEEPFEVDGHKAMRPGDFGRPEEDINCRCALLQRARWALGNNYTKWSEDAEVVIDDDGTTQFTIIEADNYKEFQKKYKQASENVAKDRLGIFSNNNKSNPKYYDFKGKDLGTVEKEIGKLDYEVGVIFDKNGKAVSCQLGGEDEIRFTKHQLKLMKGNDVTHSHPLNTPPSPEDLYMLVKNKAKSFRTSGKSGAYVLEYSKDLETLPEFDVFSNKYDEYLEELQPKYIDAVVNGMAKEEALIKLGEEIWDKLYDTYGIKPTFERR